MTAFDSAAQTDTICRHNLSPWPQRLEITARPLLFLFLRSTKRHCSVMRRSNNSQQHTQFLKSTVWIQQEKPPWPEKAALSSEATDFPSIPGATRWNTDSACFQRTFSLSWFIIKCHSGDLYYCLFLERWFTKKNAKQEEITVGWRMAADAQRVCKSDRKNYSQTAHDDYSFLLFWCRLWKKTDHHDGVWLNPNPEDLGARVWGDDTRISEQ